MGYIEGTSGHWEPGWFPPPFVADVTKLTIGVATDTAVEVATDGSLLEWLGRWWLDGSAGSGDWPVVVEVAEQGRKD